MEASYVSLLGQALVPLVLGAHQSLRVPASVRAQRRRARRAKRKLLLEDDESDDEDDDDDDETLTLGDTLLFPVLGSAVLLALYFVLKYLPKQYIDVVLGAYFTLAGMFAVHSTVGYVLGGAADALGVKQGLWHVRVSRGFKRELHCTVRRSAVVCASDADGPQRRSTPSSGRRRCSRCRSCCCRCCTSRWAGTGCCPTFSRCASRLRRSRSCGWTGS